MKIRVLIVDDHQVFRDGLKLVINTQADMEVVGEAQDGEKAIALTRELLPDIIIMDVKMPLWTEPRPPAGFLPKCPA